MKKVNIGLIGAGMVADLHMEGVKKNKRINVLWFADPNKNNLNEKLKKYSVPNGTADYRDVLKDPAVDAVVICAPPFTHLEMALAAMNAKKHVIIEKPMVANRNQMNRLVREVQKHRKLVVIECSGRHTRLQPKFRFIKKMIDDGRIGKVYHIHHYRLMRRTFIEYNPAGSWAMKKSLAAGGPFVDWGVYDLSFHLGLLDDRPQLKKMTSFARTGIKVFRDPKQKSDIEEHGAAYMEFDTGLTYYYEQGCGVHAEAPNETRIFGTRGSLRFAFCSWNSPEIEHFWVDKNRRERRTIRKVDMSKHPGDHAALYRHFLQCLDQKAKPVMPVSLAAKHLDILFKILGE